MGRAPRARSRAVAGGRSVILFDLDDTLYDVRHASRAALAALRREYPSLARRSLSWAASRYAALLEEYHARVLAGQLAFEESRLRRLQALFAEAGETISRPEAGRRTSVWRAAYRAAERPVPGAVALLRRLHGPHRVAVVSNNRTQEQRGKLRRTALEPFVDLLVTSQETGWPKPDPRIFGYALARAGGSSSAAVMVGDSWATDIRGALAAGLPAVWLNPAGAPVPEPGPVLSIPGFSPAAATALAIARWARPNAS